MGLFLIEGFGQKSFVNESYLGGFVFFGKAFYNLPEGEPYEPVLLGASYHQPFYQSKGRFNAGFNILPQMNYVPREKSIEFGVNVQLDVNYQIKDSNILSILFGADPHYVNVNTIRQADGFIFSDNVAFNYRRKVGDYSLGFLFGVRHISNAGLEQPNFGIDNLITGVALMKLLYQR